MTKADQNKGNMMARMETNTVMADAEVTPEMIEAGVAAYCQSPFEPNEREMRIIVCQIFCEMLKAQKHHS
jgi:hypothetical protein